MQKLTPARLVALSTGIAILVSLLTGATAMLMLMSQTHATQAAQRIYQENSELHYLEYQLSDVLCGVVRLQQNLQADQPKHDPAAGGACHCHECEETAGAYKHLADYQKSISKRLQQVSSPRLLSNWKDPLKYASIQVDKATAGVEAIIADETTEQAQLPQIICDVAEAWAALSQPVQYEYANQAKLEDQLQKQATMNAITIAAIAILGMFVSIGTAVAVSRKLQALLQQ